LAAVHIDNVGVPLFVVFKRRRVAIAFWDGFVLSWFCLLGFELFAD
jgi:hypothetical protein